MTPVGHGAQPSGSVDRRSEVVPVALLARSAVKAHSHSDPQRRGPVFGAQGGLRLYGGGDGVAGIGERSAEGVPDRLEHVARRTFDG